MLTRSEGFEVKVRTGTSIAAALALVGALSGCSLYAVHQTLHPYDPSDGVSVDLGDVTILNALVFTEDGEDGNFTASAVNSGDEDVDLVLQYDSDGEKVDVEVEVPAGETVRLGQDGDQILLPGIAAIPGSLLEIYFRHGERPGKQANVPVLDTSLPEYDGLLPTPMPTPTPTPTVTGAPTDGATPAPGETPAP